MTERTSAADLLRQNFLFETIGDHHYFVSKLDGQIGVLNESASALVNMLLSGLSQQEAVCALATASNVSEERIAGDLQHWLSKIQAGPGATGQPPLVAPRDAPSDAPRENRHVQHCELSGTVLEIRYPDESVAEYLQPMLGMLTPSHHARGIVNGVLEIRESEEGFLLYQDGIVVDQVDRAAALNGSLRGAIIRRANLNTRQLVLLHAACIGKGGKSLLLAAPSGHGKSTLALAMILQGFQFLGEDSVGIDLHRNRALPFPTPINLRTGAWGLFENEKLSEFRVDEVFRNGQQVRTIVPPPGSVSTTGTDIAGVVFIEFAERNGLEFEPLTINQALEKLNESGAVFHPHDIASSPRAFLLWLERTQCYRLRYADTDQAIACLELKFWGQDSGA